MHPALDASAVLPDGWVKSRVDHFAPPDDTVRKLLAVDCEMVRVCAAADGWCLQVLIACMCGCTQCMTENGSELTRMSVVDEHKAVVYDKYIKPDAPIVDYLTQCVTVGGSVHVWLSDLGSMHCRFSGITPEHMQGATTTLHDAQTFLASVVDEHTILVGHRYGAVLWWQACLACSQAATQSGE